MDGQITITKANLKKEFLTCNSCKKPTDGINYQIDAELNGKVCTCEGKICLDCLEIEQHKLLIVQMLMPLIVNKLTSGIVLR